MATIKFRRGTSYPNGLTAGEPAFRTDTDQFYIHDGVTAIWVGALISTGDIATGSTLTVPTQSAVKAYVDSNIAGGAVTNVNGITGAVGITSGTGISVSTSGKTLTIGNNGVLSFNGSTGAISFVNYVASAVAGSNITLSSATGNVTIGVTSTPSFTTVTTSSNGTIGGNLTVTGNLTVNGNTTTVNSDVMTVDDPIIVLGLSGGLPLTVSDGGKDRGVAFTYFDTAGRTGFMGYDASSGYFTFTKECTISGDVVSGSTTGNIIQIDQVRSTTDRSLALISDYTSDASIILTGAATAGNEVITVNSGTVKFTDPNGTDATSLKFMNGEGTFSNTFTITNPSADRITTFPDWGGTVVLPSNASAANYIIRSTGPTTAPNWINANAAGFTAYAAGRLETARNIALTGNVTATGVAFDGTAGITLTTVIPSSTVTNAMLVNSGITLGSTSISLGSTTTSISGMSSIAATTFTGALTGNASTATALQTARTFSLTGNVTATGITFDGTANVALSTTIGTGVVTNAMLANSGFTLGTTNITLGSTGLTLAGLSSVTATTFNGSLNGTASTATNVATTEISSGTIYLVGATAASSSIGLQIDATATTPLSYAVATGTLTCVKVEAIVDGGSY